MGYEGAGFHGRGEDDIIACRFCEIEGRGVDCRGQLTVLWWSEVEVIRCEIKDEALRLWLALANKMASQ